MCNKAVDDSLATLKLIPDRFVAIKMIKNLFAALSGEENILYFNEGFDNVAFICNEMVVLNIDLNNINIDNNFDQKSGNFLFKNVSVLQTTICPREQNVSIPTNCILLSIICHYI